MTSFSVASSPSPAAPLQDAQPSPSTSSSSFSSHLQSASSSDANNSDSTTSPKPDRSKSNNTRANEKTEHAKTFSNSAATLLGTQMPYQQVLDDRKLQLSLDRTAGQEQSQKGAAPLAGAGAAAAESAKAATTNKTAAAQNKGGVAFGANLHLDSTEVSQNATKNGTQAISEAKSGSSKNHQGSSGEEDETSKKEAAAPTANNDVPATAVAHAGPAMQNASPVAASDHVQSAYAANAASKPVAPAPAARTTEVVDTPVPVSHNKSIDVQVGSADDNAVNVRVSQRAGDVQVTVRTPDTDLAQSLRQHLPELSDRLAQTGVHGDLWQPSTSSAINDQSSDNSSGEESRSGQNAYSDGQANQKQQEKNQSAWLNQMYDAESTH